MKPDLLYLSPVVPSVTGNGLAMRGGMVLEVLAAHYSVSLLVVNLYGSQESDIPERFAQMCRRSAIANLPVEPRNRLAGLLHRRKTPTLEEILRSYQAYAFDRLHVFRLAMVPFAQELFRSSPDGERHLDLDEVESATHSRVGRLGLLNGDAGRASSEEAAANQCSLLERQACASFHRIYVSSGAEKQQLAKLYAPSDIEVLPNGVRIPEPLPGPPADVPFTFLFAGTLGYYPNEDAVLYLCREIVPRLRQGSRRKFEIEIVGSGASSTLREAVQKAGFALRGPVSDIRPSYQRAGAVVVPLRAGGGTRIKILEAWSYRRPVVTTSIGIEGIPAWDGKHAMIADSADAFAESCVRLMETPMLVRELTANAYALLCEAFSLEAIEKAIFAAGDRSH